MCRGFPYETSTTCKREGKIYVKRPILRPITLSRDSTQRQKSIQSIRSPTHARALDTSSYNCFTSCFSDAAAHMHPLCSKCWVTHAGGIGGKVANSLLRDTLALTWWRGNGRQSSDSRDQCFNVAMDEQITGVFGPNLSGLGL